MVAVAKTALGRHDFVLARGTPSRSYLLRIVVSLGFTASDLFACGCEFSSGCAGFCQTPQLFIGASWSV